MWLALEVGMLADLLVHDEDGAEWLREDIAKLNGVLGTAGLKGHVEPTEASVHSTDVYGYSGVHHLRRCAAHLHYRGVLPPPLKSGQSPTEDVLLARYGSDFVADNIGAGTGTFAAQSPRGFDHLVMHSDAEGYYVPQFFERVLIAGDQSYGWIGSCHALKAECERLAAALQLPADLLANYDDEAFFEAIEDAKAPVARPAFSWRLFKPKTPPKAAWRDHAIAALVCAKLHAFASHSIRTGALLVFC